MIEGTRSLHIQNLLIPVDCNGTKENYIKKCFIKYKNNWVDNNSGILNSH